MDPSGQMYGDGNMNVYPPHNSAYPIGPSYYQPPTGDPRDAGAAPPYASGGPIRHPPGGMYSGPDAMDFSGGSGGGASWRKPNIYQYSHGPVSYSPQQQQQWNQGPAFRQPSPFRPPNGRGGVAGGRGRGFRQSPGGRGGGGGLFGSSPKPPVVKPFCEVCRISCAGPKAFAEHEAGQKHKKQVKKQKNLENAPAAVAAATTDANTPVQEVESTPSLGKQSWYCALCEAPCNGAKSYADHLQGRAHLRRLKVCQETGKSIPTETAQPDAVTPNAAAIGDAKDKLGASSSSSAKQDDDGDADLNPEGKAKDDSTSTPGNKDQSSNASANDSPMALVGTDYIEKIADGSGKSVQYKCTLCDCMITSGPQSPNVHLTGRRHLLNFKRKVDPLFSAAGVTGNRTKRARQSQPPTGQMTNEFEVLSTIASGLPPPMLNHAPVLGPGVCSPSGGPARPTPVYAYDSRIVGAKHSSISPNLAELRFIRLAVSTVENSLKKASDDLSINLDATTNDSSEKTKPPFSHRVLRGALRVGALGMRLLLRHETTGQLVLMCAHRPSAGLANWLADKLPTYLEAAESTFTYAVKWDDSKERIIVKCNLNQSADSTAADATVSGSDASTVKVPPPSPTPVQPMSRITEFSIHIHLTSPEVLEDGGAKEDDKKTESENGDKKAVAATDEDDEMENNNLGKQLLSQGRQLDLQRCIDALQLIDKTKWFQSVGHIHPLSTVSRVLRNFIYTNDEWADVDEFSMLALLDRLLSVEYSLAAQMQSAASNLVPALPMQPPRPSSPAFNFHRPRHHRPSTLYGGPIQVLPGRLFRCFFEAIASGALMKEVPANESGATAGSSKRPPHPFVTMVKSDDPSSLIEKKNLLTMSAQNIVRLIAFKQLSKVLDIDMSARYPPPTPSTPSELESSEDANKVDDVAAAAPSEDVIEIVEDEEPVTKRTRTTRAAAAASKA